ncbi:MAG: iron chelate uptake ABC transporter family permease subunit [Anaerolineae bacterium]
MQEVNRFYTDLYGMKADDIQAKVMPVLVGDLPRLMHTTDRLRPSLTRLFVWLGAGLLVVLILSTFVGRYPKPYWMPPQLLWQDDMAQQPVLSLRLPRMVVALLLGMSLSAAGAVMQMIFRNPLVEPGFLGVTQGAAFGAALSILWISTAPLMIEASATFLRCWAWPCRIPLSGTALTLRWLGAAHGVSEASLFQPCSPRATAY